MFGDNLNPRKGQFGKSRSSLPMIMKDQDEYSEQLIREKDHFKKQIFDINDKKNGMFDDNLNPRKRIF